MSIPSLTDAFADFTAKIQQSQEALERMTLRESWFVGRDEVIFFEGRPYAHPSTVMRLRNNGRTPLWSARSLGERELRRDRRRHR